LVPRYPRSRRRGKEERERVRKKERRHKEKIYFPCLPLVRSLEELLLASERDVLWAADRESGSWKTDLNAN
jgi:hypothetical protein